MCMFLHTYLYFYQGLYAGVTAPLMGVTPMCEFPALLSPLPRH